MRKNIEYNTYFTGVFGCLILHEVGSYPLFYLILSVVFLILMLTTQLKK